DGVLPMLTCTECRSLLLDRLYDLLEPTEEATVTAHLADCPACQAEHLKAERVQRLISTAARTEFPDVRFIAPAAEVAPAAPSRDGAPRPAGFPRWLGWAVAAAVLVAVGAPTGAHLAAGRRQQQELNGARQRAEQRDQ